MLPRRSAAPTAKTTAPTNRLHQPHPYTLPYGAPSLFQVDQLWLITARKPLIAVSVPLSIRMNAANATHPVQPVAPVGARGVVEELFRLVLDMVSSWGRGWMPGGLIREFRSVRCGTRDEGPPSEDLRPWPA